MCFRPRFCICKAILGWGKPGICTKDSLSWYQYWWVKRKLSIYPLLTWTIWDIWDTEPAPSYEVLKSHFDKGVSYNTLYWYSIVYKCEMKWRFFTVTLYWAGHNLGLWDESLWIMPLVQVWSLDRLTSSAARYHCDTDAPLSINIV